MKNNHVELKGTLTRNIEISRSQKGNSFTKFTLKCLRDDQGTRFDYVGCIAFGEIAEKLEIVGSSDTRSLAIYKRVHIRKMIKRSIQ